MTQKGDLFKGQKKRKTIPPSRHGKAPHNRKGKRVGKSASSTKDMETDRIARIGKSWMRDPAVDKNSYGKDAVCRQGDIGNPLMELYRIAVGLAMEDESISYADLA